MNTSSASALPPATARSSSKVTILSRRDARPRSNVVTAHSSLLVPAPLRLNSLRLRGTKYSTQRSTLPAERLAAEFLWKFSSVYAEDFLLGKLLNLVGFELSILKLTCGLFSWPEPDGPSAVSLCQETTAMDIFSSHASTLCTARDFEPPVHSAVKPRNAILKSS